jgi:hypothetical protein
MPLFEDEKSGETTALPAWMIANRLGRKLHEEPIAVAAVDPVEGTIVTTPIFRQCPEWFTFKNGTSSVRCQKEAGHKEGEHRGWRANWKTNGRT